MRNRIMSHPLIKLCPFCGKEPELFPKNPKREGNAWGAVSCVNTKCSTFDSFRHKGVTVEDGEDVADDRGTAEYQNAARLRWNVRWKAEYSDD